MTMLSIRSLPSEVHRALRVQAASHGRSTAAEVRDILCKAVKPHTRLLMGDALNALASANQVSNTDIAALQQSISHKPAEPMQFI